MARQASFRTSSPSNNPRGQFYVEVFDTDKYFRTSCVLTPLVEWPAPDKPFSKIEIGTYIVGREISPGIYAGRAGTEILDSCSWERLSGASGEFSDIIAIDNPRGQFYVEVFDTDKYFRTSCALELDLTKTSRDYKRRGILARARDCPRG